MTLKFYNSVAKVLKLKFITFLWLITTFVEVTGEKLVGGGLFKTTFVGRNFRRFVEKPQNLRKLIHAKINFSKTNLREN